MATFNMRFLIITMLVFPLFLTGKPDDTECKRMNLEKRVISKNGVFLRSEPDQKSKPLCSLAYWEKLDVCWANQGQDTINNIAGNWQMVKHQKLRGYVFDGFLTYTDSTISKDKDFRFFQEGYHCSLANFDPSLYWYGIYETIKGDSLINVELTIRKPNLDDKLQLPTEIIFETNLSKEITSKFLIGSRKPLNQGLVNLHSLHEAVFLYPGQTYNLSGWSKKKTFFNTIKIGAFGNVSENIQSPKIDNYGLQLSDRNDDYKTQDISDYLKHREHLFGQHKIYWYGDLDGDHSVDIVMLAVSNSGAYFSLLLSSISQPEEFVTMADEWTQGYCN